MIKARIDRVEKAFGGVPTPWKGTIRIAPFFDDEPIPIADPDEDLILLHVIRTPRPPARDPTNGGGVIAEADLAAEVARLEEERDALKKGQASERGSRGHPRRAVTSAGIRGGPGGEG